MFLAFALTSCGGGGNSPENVADVETHRVPLDGINTAGLATWLGANSERMETVPAGDTYDANGVRFTCQVGGADCQITVSQNEQGITATSTGGSATATAVPSDDDGTGSGNRPSATDTAAQMPIPLDRINTAGLATWLGADSERMETVPAGDTYDANGVRFTCQVGGADCQITVSQNEQGNIIAISTGGSATAIAVPTQQPTASGGGSGSGNPPPQQTPEANTLQTLQPDTLQTAIAAVVPDIAANLPSGIGLGPTEEEILTAENALRGDNGLGAWPTWFSRRTEITKSGNPLSYESVKPLPAWLGITTDNPFNSGWQGRLYRDGKSWGVVYQNLPQQYPSTDWNTFFSPGGEGYHDNLSLNKSTGKLTWSIGQGSKRSSLSAFKLDQQLFDPGSSIALDAVAVLGAFYGRRGEIDCKDSLECILRSADSGATFWIERGELSFTPTESEIPDHFHLGYWLNAPETVGGDWSVEPFAIANFYGGTVNSYFNLGTQFAGTASFAGPAVGVYTVDQGVTGQFYAHATLTANWKIPNPATPGTIKNGESFVISGAVNNFNSLSSDQHGLYIRDWSLTLDRADIAALRGSNDEPQNISLSRKFRGGVTTGSGGTASQTGDWTGRFWGLDNTVAAGGERNEPIAVTGEFTGHFTDDYDSGKAHAGGSVAGAFVGIK